MTGIAKKQAFSRGSEFFPILYNFSMWFQMSKFEIDEIGLFGTKRNTVQQGQQFLSLTLPRLLGLAKLVKSISTWHAAVILTMESGK